MLADEDDGGVAHWWSRGYVPDEDIEKFAQWVICFLLAALDMSYNTNCQMQWGPHTLCCLCRKA